jgi:hemin uptake protein HemP
VTPKGDAAGAAPAPPAPLATPSDAVGEGEPACREIASESLFAGAREVRIRHGGSFYRLKKTALGKLILTK